jgi:broad specificity phosphatase PhoE
VKVVLLRHGKVDYPPIRMMNAQEFKDWVNAYNVNRLDRKEMPSDHVIEMVQSVYSVICSDLPRSVESANYLGVKDVSLTSPHLREAELPIGEWKFPKLSVRIWAIYFRVAWFLGYSKGSESYSEAKERSKIAASILIEEAVKHDSVLFVGHGVINRLIAKELRLLGWLGPKVPAMKYWEYSIYQKKHNSDS